MNQEQEEEELHRRLNGSNPEIIEYEDQNDRFETMKQKEIMKRWQINNAIMQKGTSFKTPRRPN